MIKKIYTLIAVLCAASIYSFSQVKIGDNPGTINSNSLLELESTSKGVLPPRVTLTDVNNYAPLNSSIVEGMIVYNNGGTLSKGLYIWSGSVWKKIETTEGSPVIKTGNASLTKNETLVLVNSSTSVATITLPNISSVDNGLAITIKNIGGAEDLVTVLNAGDDPIDGGIPIKLTRWGSQKFIAGNSGWIIADRKYRNDNVLEVDSNSSWTTIPEVISFLEEHMTGPTVVRLGDGEYQLSATQIIDLPFAVTFQGLSYGTASILSNDEDALGGKPMFRCYSDCYFKMLDFFHGEATYGDSPGEDAIHFVGEDTYNEIKDCTFDGFYSTIIDSSNAELWVFETDISNAERNGILLHSDVAGAILKVAETDFIACNYGINLSKGDSATIQLASGGYYNGASGDTAIFYQPGTFTNFSSIAITGNSWNNTGVYIAGFDFTRSDGRDANAILESNAGMGDQKPNCFINKLNSSATTTLSTQNSWYKADWGSNTSSETCKWTINENEITYQPNNSRNGIFTVTGNLSVNSSNQNISIGIVKNNSTGTRYGETTLRVTTANQPFQFSFIAFLEDIDSGDTFEIYLSNGTSGSKVVTIQDIQWLANTQ